MNKCPPEKLKDAADDLQVWLLRHAEVTRAEPEITKTVIDARDKLLRRTVPPQLAMESQPNVQGNPPQEKKVE